MPIRVHNGDVLPVGPARPAAAPAHAALVAAAGQVIQSIRKVIFAFGPVAPRTAMHVTGTIDVSGTAGGTASVVLAVRNRQAALTMVSASLSLLRGADGSQWMPEHEIEVGRRLLPPGESTTVSLLLAIAADTPAGTYDGSVRCSGVDGSVVLRVDVQPIVVQPIVVQPVVEGSVAEVSGARGGCG